MTVYECPTCHRRALSVTDQCSCGATMDLVTTKGYTRRRDTAAQKHAAEQRLRPPIDIYTDGGVIGKNPSERGGTWGFVVVKDGKAIYELSGILRPIDISLPVVTNNMTELWAIMSALEWSNAWTPTIYTDSIISFYRLTKKKAKWAGIPNDIRERFVAARSRHALPVKAVHLKGHPTKAMLASGRCPKGTPVSKWNVRADDLCNAEARRFARGEYWTPPTTGEQQ